MAQAAALEKSGKKVAALTYYTRVVKEFPDTASARLSLVLSIRCLLKL